MRIGITCFPTYGGSGAVATELGLALAGRGHEVHFIAAAQPFRLAGFTERVYFHEVGAGRYPLFEHTPYALPLAVKMHEVVVRERLDLLHVHYAIPHATCAWLAKELLDGERRLAVVTTLHGTDITLVGQDPSYFTIARFSIERSDAVTAVSDYLRDETYRAFGCVDCDIEVIPNFVNLADFRPADDRGSASPLRVGDEKVLMHISNMRPVKRLLDVVRIFAKVRERVPSTLVLVGDGPDRIAAEREAERLGVAPRVRFLGMIEQVAGLLRCADLYLLPSQSESFGLTALEALATGVPVVGTNVGGLPEVVIHGSCGFLAGAGDVDSLAAGAVELLADGDRWRSASEAARRRAAEFATERIVPRYEALYETVLAR